MGIQEKRWDKENNKGTGKWNEKAGGKDNVANIIESGH
jgi:hypothetical protein